MTGPLDIVFHLAKHLHMLPLAPPLLHSPVLTLSGMHAVLESGAEDEGYRLSWGGTSSRKVLLDVLLTLVSHQMLSMGGSRFRPSHT